MVAGLQLRDVRVSFGEVRAVDGVDLQLDPGAVVGILGPSGSGKSTLLRAVAGLERLTSGQVLWGGTDLSSVKVHQRGFGFVFQDGQLFTNMNVGSNIAYGLRQLGREARRERVLEMLRLVGLEGYASRKVTQLSGGQAQRVALARSLAPSPRLLLLDEPLSALDRGLRERLAGELAAILRRVGTTAIYVTHDQDEAATVADTVAVMDHGRILQRAEPDVLWGRPASKDVARFLGFTSFVGPEEARRLGWSGSLPAGHMLGLGQRSLELDPDGVGVPVIHQGFDLGMVEIGVRLPGGQEAVVLSEERVPHGTVRVRLVGGAQVPV